jgi:hypothetical protein
MKANDIKEIRSALFGWEDLYTIYSSGKIFSHRKSRFLRPSLRGLYYSVTLSRNKYKERHNLHRLIALAFIPNPINKPCVNHKDGNKLNNRVDNLEWVTYSENERHSFDCLGKIITHSNETRRKISEKSKGRDMTKLWQKSSANRRGKPAHNRVSITRVDSNGVTKKYESISDAAKDVNGVISAFTALKSGKLKTYKNHKWTFEN